MSGILLHSPNDLVVTYAVRTIDEPLDSANLAALSALKAGNPHLRTLIAVGGWTMSSNFSDIAASPQGRASFAESCVSFVTNHALDGVDLDWEYPVNGGMDGNEHRPDDDDNYLTLVTALRARLDVQSAQDGKPYLLTAAVPAGWQNLTNRFRLREMARELDWMNLMTYDMAGPWDSRTGHLAPLYGNPAAPDPHLNVHKTVWTYLLEGVPRDKLVLGLPYYGRGFKAVNAASNGLFQAHGGVTEEGTWEKGVFDFRDLAVNCAGTNGFQRFWDGSAMVPWLYNATSAVFITYEDAESIGLKMDYAVSNGLRGVMCWSIDGDRADSRLQRTVYRATEPLAISGAELRHSSCGPGIALTWEGIAGENYRISASPSLAVPAWTVCSNLFDGQGDPVGSLITGRNESCAIIDTNIAGIHSRFYRLATPQ